MNKICERPNLWDQDDSLPYATLGVFDVWVKVCWVFNFIPTEMELRYLGISWKKHQYHEMKFPVIQAMVVCTCISLYNTSDFDWFLGVYVLFEFSLAISVFACTGVYVVSYEHESTFVIESMTQKALWNQEEFLNYEFYVRVSTHVRLVPLTTLQRSHIIPMQFLYRSPWTENQSLTFFGSCHYFFQVDEVFPKKNRDKNRPPDFAW